MIDFWGIFWSVKVDLECKGMGIKGMGIKGMGEKWLTMREECESMGFMKRGSIFYSESMKWLIEGYVEIYYHSRWGQLLHCLLAFIFPFIVLLPMWYMMDVVGNIYDWVCMKIFVDMVIWGLEQSKIGYENEI